LIILGALLAGLAFGIGLAAAAEHQDESVRAEDEAARIFGKPVLSAIPQILFAGQRRSRLMRTAGMLAGTLAASVVAGFAFSFLAARFF
jgi:hypothetical protein